MNHDQMKRAMLARREFAVDLPDGRRVTLRRPSELEIQANHVVLVPNPEDPAKPRSQLQVLPERVHQLAVDWAGFTETCLVGSAGGSDPVPYHPELLRLWLEENTDAVVTLCTAALGAISDHLNARADAEKN